jgi:4'-phosphopantetheinyl transferase
LRLHPAAGIGQIGAVSDFLPSPGRATVVIVDPALIGDSLVTSCLSQAEFEQAERFRFEEDARHWRACRAALRSVLGEALGTDPASLVFEFGEHGKPRLASPHHHLHFNLSHCPDLALVAMARSGPVGIDLEAAGRADCLLGCESSFCHAQEIAALPSASATRATALLDLWTTKEALLKALGTGMSLAPDSVSLAGPGGHCEHALLRPFALHPLRHPGLDRHVARLAAPRDIGDIDILTFTT